MIGTDIDYALEVLSAGGLVAVPTETVYGLAGDSHNPDSIARIFSVKGRPTSRPLSMLIPSQKDIPRYAQHVPHDVAKLVEAFWPGPLTLVFKKQHHILDQVTANLDTIGLRCPNQALTQTLLNRFGKALAAPSANMFGQPSPKTAEAVFESLGERVEYILDGGPTECGLESSIIDVSTRPFKLIREAYLSHEQLSEVSEEKIIKIQ